MAPTFFDGGRKKRAAAARAALEADAATAGWSWHGPAPLPSIEICEAALRGKRPPTHFFDHGTGPIWGVGVASAVSGVIGDRGFTAGRLSGYERGNTNGGTHWGELKETAALWCLLPSSLPEIRLVDRNSSAADNGLRLPPLPSPPPLGPRWGVEGFLPAFATELLTPEFVGALDTMPACSAVVIRAGTLLTYGFEPWDAAAIRERAVALDRLIRAVPPPCWGRADALVAGYGVFPHKLADGERLRLDLRLVRPDWQGHGLSKFGWQTVEDLDATVILKGRESFDVFTPPAGAPSPGFSIRWSGSGDPLEDARERGIPTLASTLTPGGTATPDGPPAPETPA